MKGKRNKHAQARTRHTLLFVVALMGVILSTLSATAFAQDESPTEPALSSYWNPLVSRWEDIIIQYAQDRQLDPDLIAAVIWKESLGRAEARGPTGAVGLMGLKAFEWRPSPEELETPWTNLFWGARALAHTIRDGKGDLYYSLAAYNGGWDQIHLRVTRRYATDVLNHYARAVAISHGLPADGKWSALFAIEGDAAPDTITVLGPQRPLSRYTKRPFPQANVPAVPTDVPPHATAITFVDQRGIKSQVNVWLLTGDGSPLVSRETHPSSSHPISANAAYRTQPILE